MKPKEVVRAEFGEPLFDCWTTPLPTSLSHFLALPSKAVLCAAAREPLLALAVKWTTPLPSSASSHMSPSRLWVLEAIERAPLH